MNKSEAFKRLCLLKPAKEIYAMKDQTLKTIMEFYAFYKDMSQVEWFYETTQKHSHYPRDHMFGFKEVLFEVKNLAKHGILEKSDKTKRITDINKEFKRLEKKAIGDHGFLSRFVKRAFLKPRTSVSSDLEALAYFLVNAVAELEAMHHEIGNDLNMLCPQYIKYKAQTMVKVEVEVQLDSGVGSCYDLGDAGNEKDKGLVDREIDYDNVGIDIHSVGSDIGEVSAEWLAFEKEFDVHSVMTFKSHSTVDECDGQELAYGYFSIQSVVIDKCAGDDGDMCDWFEVEKNGFDDIIQNLAYDYGNEIGTQGAMDKCAEDDEMCEWTWSVGPNWDDKQVDRRDSGVEVDQLNEDLGKLYEELLITRGRERIRNVLYVKKFNLNSFSFYH